MNCFNSGLDYKQQVNDSDLRFFIYQFFLEKQRGPVVEEIIKETGISREMILSQLESLTEDHLVVFDSKINSLMIVHPFSGIPTAFTVQLESGTEFYAPCAWDSIAFHFMLDKIITIQSFCFHCNDKITLTLKQNEFETKDPEGALVHIEVPIGLWWDNILDTCFNRIKFFSSQKHYNEWIEQNPERKGYCLSDSQILELSKFLYVDKLKYDYTRPTEAQTKSLLEKLNLTGDFWDF